MRKPPPKTIGETVRDLRLGCGMTQWDLAAASGLGRATIQNIETGKHRTTTRASLRLIAAALNVPVDQLTKAA